jgi:hypothetical protein
MIKKTFCDPQQSDIQEGGMIHPEEMANQFRSFPWDKYYSVFKADPDSAQYSPSLCFSDTTSERSIEISLMDKEEDESTYGIWFTRPKEIKYFGLFPVLKKKYTSEIRDQDEEDCLQVIECFQRNETDKLEITFNKKSG